MRHLVWLLTGILAIGPLARNGAAELLPGPPLEEGDAGAPRGWTCRDGAGYAHLRIRSSRENCSFQMHGIGYEGKLLDPTPSPSGSTSFPEVAHLAGSLAVEPVTLGSLAPGLQNVAALRVSNRWASPSGVRRRTCPWGRALRHVLAGVAGLVGGCLWFLPFLCRRPSEDELRAELARVALCPRFQAGMRALREATGMPVGAGAWELSLKRCVGARPTHVLIEAVARRNDEEVLLWGRCYTWWGHLKSFERLGFPAYENAYWRALCVLRGRGLPAAVPVVHAKLRGGLLRGGGTILTEHLGRPQAFREFVRSRLSLLPPEAQKDLLLGLLRYVKALHAAGLYRVKMRYIHTRDLDAAANCSFYVLDLDKVLVWERCPRLIAARLRRTDMQRLARALKKDVSPGVFLELQEQLEWARRERDQEPLTR